MNTETVIKVTNATVRFNKATEQYNGLKEYVIKMLKGELMFQEFLALKDVNLEVKKGESWGLIGTNGSARDLHLRAEPPGNYRRQGDARLATSALLSGHRRHAARRAGLLRHEGHPAILRPAAD